MFAADVHLRPDAPERTERFFRWLEAEAPRSRVTYLLGDLFDLWVGSGQMRDPFYEPIVERLAACVRAGATIEFVHGNRDFLIGRTFERATGIRVHEDPIVAPYDGGETVLTHGDLLCAADRSYQRTRRVLRSRPVRGLGAMLPLGVVRAIGARLRRYSDRAVSEKSREILEPPDDAVIAMSEAGRRRTILCGHLHHAMRRTYQRGGVRCELIVLGDWGRGASYVEWIDGRYRLFVADGGHEGEGADWTEVTESSGEGV